MPLDVKSKIIYNMDKSKAVEGKEFQVEIDHLDNLTNSFNLTIKDLD